MSYGKFLTLPVSWRGTIAQYVGRLHRLYDGKRDVRVYDYADLNVPILAFDGWGRMEVDLVCTDSRVVIEVDGAQHLADPIAYRRDRRKDRLLQDSGYLVLRYLAEDLAKELDSVLDGILRSLSSRRTRTSVTVIPMAEVRRSGA